MVWVTVDVELDEFEDDELVEELESRGFKVYDEDSTAYTQNEMINLIYQNKRLGKDYDKLLDDLIYQTIGRVL